MPQYIICWLTLPEAAELSGLPYDYLLDAAKSGKLTARTFGSKGLKTTSEELNRFTRVLLYGRNKKRSRQAQEMAEKIDSVYQIRGKSNAKSPTNDLQVKQEN